MSDWAARFEGCATSHISDAMARLPGSTRLRPLHRGGRLLGPAFTVRTRSGDNLWVHQALRVLQPGQVLVVDGGGDTSRALVGEILKRIAQQRGCAGFVVDGAVRDVDAFAGNDFPCFARAVTHRGPYKNGPGELAVPVTIDGMLVQPGDVVVGDADGVVVVPLAQAAGVAEQARAIVNAEAATLAQVAAGTYDDRWLDGALAAAVPVPR